MKAKITAEAVVRMKNRTDNQVGGRRLGQIMAEVFTEGLTMAPEDFIQKIQELAEKLARGIGADGRPLEDWPTGQSYSVSLYTCLIQLSAQETLGLGDGFMAEVYKIHQANRGPELD